MDEIQQIEQAIAALEAQRAVLGDETVEVSLGVLRGKLAALKDAAAHKADGLDASADSMQQRKQATILFTDIAGHTNLTRDLDPEENMEIIDGALVRLAGVIEAHGGHVARFQGDGFKAVFGLPTARESDPENAVRAGLALVRTAKAYGRELAAHRGLSGFNVRVGIDTGLIVSGGETEAEDTIKGMVVNLAARLESAAPVGGVLISQHTYQHVRGLFDVEALEPIQAKGFPEPVPVYTVQGAKKRAFRMRTRGVENLETRTVGRGAELAALQAAYHRAVEQERSAVVSLVGEAGVGKSRLVDDFVGWLELLPEAIWLFKGRASQQTQGIPLFPLRDMLAERFGILEGDSLAALREKFNAGVGSFLAEAGGMKAHILGAWLGYDFNDSPHVQAVQGEPQQVRNRASLYLAQLLAAAGAQAPVVILLDDIHWADEGTLAAITDLVRRQPGLPMLVVCLARPALYERSPDWGQGLAFHERVDLEPLSKAETIDLVAEILRLAVPAPVELIELVSQRAEGNPYYAEELIKMLIDDRVIVPGAASWQVRVERLADLRVPDTLTGVLQARLDKLAPADKLAIQEAAVIGRTFWDQTLAAMQANALEALPRLQTRELIYQQGEGAFEGTLAYSFKHALLRDVTYESVLRRLRRQYHALVADWLAAAAEASGRADEFAGRIGEHYHLAGDTAEAAGWYCRAGVQAAGAFANQDAVRYLDLALEHTLAAEPGERFDILEVRARVHHRTGDRAAEAADIDQLARLAEEMGPAAQGKTALYRAFYAEAVSDYAGSLAYARAAVAIGRETGDMSVVADGCRSEGMALYRLGKYDQTRQSLQAAIEIARDNGDQELVSKCYYNLGLTAWDLGDYEAAKGYFERALAIDREGGRRHSEGAQLNGLGYVARNQGDFRSARMYYEQAMAVYNEIGDRLGEAAVLNNLGVMALHQGDLGAAETHYERSLAIQRQIGNRYGEGICINNLGDVALLRGDYPSAREHLEQALVISQEIDDRVGVGIILGTLGAVALLAGEPAQAEAHYLAAISIHEALNQAHFLAEDWAGLGKVKVTQGDETVASDYIQKVQDYLQENPRLEGLGNPILAFRFIWEALDALGRPEEAREVMASAAGLIEDYLAEQPEPELREMYLSQPHHATLWAAWNAKDRVRRYL